MYSQECVACDTVKIYMCPMDERDKMECNKCGRPLRRLIDKPGMVWAPTSSAGGATHR